MKDDIRITKISISESKSKDYPVTIAYDRDVPEGDVETVKLPGQGAPHPDLTDAMDLFLELAIAAIRLDPSEWTADLAHVIGITLKQDDGIAGINVSVLGKFQEEDGSAIAVTANSPYIPFERLSSGDIAAIELLCREAVAYISGKRSQCNLFAVEAA